MSSIEQLLFTPAIFLFALGLGFLIAESRYNERCTGATPIMIESVIYVCQKQAITPLEAK